MDPWDILRNFTIPDETTVETNMRGKKKKKGDVESLLIVERNKGIVYVDERKFMLVPPVLTSLPAENIEKLPVGFLQIELSDDYILIETDPLGIHPAYYARTHDGYAVSSRKEWLKKLTPLIFEMPNNMELELSMESIYFKEKMKETTIKIHDISIVKASIKEFINAVKLIPHLNIVYLFEPNYFSFYTLLELIKSDHLRESMITVVRNENDLNIVKRLSTELSVDVKKMVTLNEIAKNDISEITIKAEDVEELTNRYNMDYLKIFLQRNSLFLVSIVNNVYTTNHAAGNTAVNAIFESKYYHVLRELFKVSWPSTLADPLLFGQLKTADLNSIANVIAEYLKEEFESFLTDIHLRFQFGSKF